MMSPQSARKADALGYTHTKVFHTGLPSWKKAKNIVIAEPGYIKTLQKKDIAHVLIDLRNPAEASKGFITGAVSIPAERLSVAKQDFPGDKSAPVILYTEKDVSADLFKTVRNWGYKNTSILKGGIASWKKSGGSLTTGTLATTISYVPKPRPGEIQIDEFKKLAGQRSPDTIILDVRDPDEAMYGMLVGAVNIPVNELETRIGELPKDKEIILYCETGIRAGMAYDILEKNGYKTRFLNAIVQVDADGKFEVSKK
jgi:rhodanese-related sulfurtransferase